MSDPIITAAKTDATALAADAKAGAAQARGAAQSWLRRNVWGLLALAAAASLIAVLALRFG